MNNKIAHLAIIMDGNARWAKQERLSKTEGHMRGAETAKDIISVIANYKIPYTTLYAFSSENWQRPVEEITVLIELLAHYVEHETKLLKDNGIRLKIIGNLERLPSQLQQRIKEIVQMTSNNKAITICIAFGYGGRDEITSACKKIIDLGIKNVTENTLRQHLYDPEMPDVDLLIRTGGEHRISNFLLWQAAYAELYFLEKYWPDFSKKDLDEALIYYSGRTRNFGSRKDISNQDLLNN
jgi:undecaprenyl diphosphate synthase